MASWHELPTSRQRGRTTMKGLHFIEDDLREDWIGHALARALGLILTYTVPAR